MTMKWEVAQRRKEEQYEPLMEEVVVVTILRLQSLRSLHLGNDPMNDLLRDERAGWDDRQLKRPMTVKVKGQVRVHIERRSLGCLQ
jgi:hypothetical protein